MLLTELDGFLTGLLVCPAAIPPEEWMTVIWGTEAEGIAPFEDPLDVQWFASAVAARRAEIARDLDRGKLQPIFDIDERNGDVLWEYWVDGFAEAFALRPEAWETMVDAPARAAPLSRMKTLIAIARDESDLDSRQINALQEGAAADVMDVVQRLYAAHAHGADRTSIAGPATRASKVGRNDPCPCGSGKKQKHCCM